ncbi:hypothetical protein G7046_g3414 [Stylonectria norvegica]|nr:hypothetical protein G7046_g3414 [Stylonectria norvegica]
MVQQNEIRVLHLLPHLGKENAPIQCDIRVVGLATKPKYEALSYVWGSSTTLLDIVVAGQKVGVTPNLHALLRRVRQPKKTRTLWVDQLCINQWDTKEKAEQVRLMRTIYSNCQSCLIWMGEVREDIQVKHAAEGLDFLRYMAAIADEDDQDSIPVPSSMASDAKFLPGMKALRTMSYAADLKEGNPWWARIWTVQEAVLPQHLVLLWGPLSMQWEDMELASQTWVTGFPDVVWKRLETPFSSFLGDMMAMVIWLRIAGQTDDTPMEMVNRWRFRLATDRRDKIYALIGLYTSGTLPRTEQCNYDLTPVEVFCSLTIDLIMSEEGLKPLIADPRLEAEKATPGIPRWAIDVSEISGFNTDWYHLYGYNHYNACGDYFLDLGALQTRADEDDLTLLLKGVLVDTIDVVSERRTSLRRDEAGADRIKVEKLREMIALAHKHVNRGTPASSELYPGGYTLRQAFGRLVLGDLRRDDEQRPDDRPVDDEAIEEVYRFKDTGVRNDLHMTIQGMIQNQVFFITKTGLMGMGHLDTKPGDAVVVFYGGKVPFTVAKRKGGEEEYDFGGRCYVQGIMDGELFMEEEEVARRTRTMTIY